MLRTFKTNIVSSWLAISVCLLILQGCGGLYHKPAFDGKVLDYGSEQPIEGAVVVATYNKLHPGIGAGGGDIRMAIQETLTDNQGLFHFPSFTRLISPPYLESDVSFTIYKPGYGGIYGGVSALSLEDCLSATCQGKEYSLRNSPETRTKITTGHIYIPKLHSRKQRIDSMVKASRCRNPKFPTVLLDKSIKQEELFLWPTK